MILLSETIIVALITMASGLFGSAIGAFMSFSAINRESKRHIREEKKACFSQFISLYHALSGQIATNNYFPDKIDSEKEIELFLQFQTAYANAVLICNASSVDVLSALWEQVGILCQKRENPDVRIAYVAAMSAMRKELGVS